MFEFLVAFTLFVLFLAATFAALAVAIRGDHKAAFLTMGTLLAKSKLAAAGIEYPLSVGTIGGTFTNGYRWQAKIYRHGIIESASGRSVRAFQVQVTVAEPIGAGERTISLAGVEIDRGLRP